jgi:exosortase/archaeosortase family protein
MRVGIEARMGTGDVVRENNRSQSKEDLSWAEVGEMAYGYLRIPIVLVIVEVIYWWSTDPAASFEPYQRGIATIWVAISNLFWPGSAELVFHGPSQAWTGVNLSLDSGIVERLYVSDECAGIHEIIFLGVLMMLTPGISNRTRWRSIAGMALFVQILNYIRLIVLYPIANGGSVDDMFAFHNFILSQGFLAILIFIWLIWYIVLDRKGLIDRKEKPSLSDMPKLKQFRFRESLPKLSIAILIFAGILAVWATHAVTLDDENMEIKAIAEDCNYVDDKWTDSSGGDTCYPFKNMWDDVWGRTIRGWLFAGIFSAMAIITIHPENDGMMDSEEE